MKKTYKGIALLAALVLSLSLLSGCGSEKTETKEITVVTTIFPICDWVRQIVGETESVKIILLESSGADMHSYQPSADDMVRIADCDLFIYVGGESDAWAENVLKASSNPNRKVISLMDNLGRAAKEETPIEGAQTEETAAGGSKEYDEHVWLSLRNAQRFCSDIREVLSALDPANQETYTANAESYQTKLKLMDERFAAGAEAYKDKAFIFGDRFPFRYLMDDYGFRYYAAFSGCSAEVSASFETVIFLAQKIDELGLRAILQTENAADGLAETIRQNTAAKDQEILTLNSMQAVTAGEIAGGATYLDMMQNNLSVLWQVLTK